MSPAEPDDDDLADARDDLPNATQDEVQRVADQRAAVRQNEEDRS